MLKKFKNLYVIFIVLIAPLVVPLANAMDMELEGKKALVTGSTSNIGYAIAKSLLSEGADVIINSRKQEDIDATIEKLKEETGLTAMGFRADVINVEDIAALVEMHPDVDILVNNVGPIFFGAFNRVPDKVWNDSWALNVMSGVRLSRAYFDYMKDQDWGRIIFMSAETAYNPRPENIQYGAVKAAQLSLARGLAVAFKETGVTVNSVVVGPTQTAESRQGQMMPRMMGVDTFEEAEEKLFDTIYPEHLLQRYTHPDEIAKLVTYLASPVSSATTGAAVRADGGEVRSGF